METAGTLLDGRVVYRQFDSGYRTGIEPVLMAASVPARPGQHVLEAGTGAGAGLLCLAARVPGLVGTGIEQDDTLAGLAQRNAAANGFSSLTIQPGDVLAASCGGPFDHAMANPPWHSANSTAGPDPARDRAKRGQPGLLAAWTAAMTRCLRSRGTLTLIVPARATAEALAALDAAGCGSLALLPLWPAAQIPARIVIVQGVRGGRGGTRLLPGLTLHDAPASYSASANAVLRQGLPISL